MFYSIHILTGTSLSVQLLKVHLFPFAVRQQFKLHVLVNIVISRDPQIGHLLLLVHVVAGVPQVWVHQILL